jgi:hypothetical protein
MKYFLKRCTILVVLLLVLYTTYAQQKIDLLEYGIDAIPPYGQATPIVVSTPISNLSNVTFNINIASLGSGIHTLFMRSRSSVSGDSIKWGITNYQYFYKQNSVSVGVSDINKLEYFIDTDPGEGKATAISVTPATQVSGIVFSPNISALSAGFHALFIRSMDANGKWSITNYTYFYKQSSTAAIISNIVKLEYFIDTDPGAGKATTVSVAPATNIAGLSFNADISSITAGFHILFIRSLDADGKWSITNTTYFYKSAPQNNNTANIVKIEYYIDTDPGDFNAINIPITAAPDIADQTFTANITGLAAGTHYLDIRSLDSRGKWSVNAVDTFNIASTVPLRLLNFSAMAEDTFVNVSWQTAFEQSIGTFEVEHSTDGIVFTKIGTVLPTNNASGSSYNFKDLTPSLGENFYRLKIIEMDGSFSYSNIKVVRFDNGSNYVSIYPNPAKDIVNVLFQQVPQGNTQLQLKGINGQTLQSFTITGLQSKELNVSTLANGIYELHIISDKINISQKIIVQH